MIRPGDAILDIVPLNEDLVIDARVSPVDIDAVAQGQEAQIHLLAYAQRNLPRIEGTVTTVSADALTDEQTGESFFPRQGGGRPGPAGGPARRRDALRRHAGGGADHDRERTALQYILQPFLDSIRRSFREKLIPTAGPPGRARQGATPAPRRSARGRIDTWRRSVIRGPGFRHDDP